MHQIISEGLVKYPPRMEADILKRVAYWLFWMLRQKCSNEYPKHRAAVIAEAAKWGVKLPITKFEMPEKGFVVEDMTLDFGDMPPEYARLTPDRTIGFLVIDFRDKGDSLANFWDRKGDDTKQAVITINLMKLRGVNEFPARRLPEEVPYMMSRLRGTLQHELRHLVQFVLLAPKDQRQIKRLPGYNANGDEYYGSPIERDPHIGNAVREFAEHYAILTSRGSRLVGKPNLRKFILQFVGMAPPAVVNGFEPHEIFTALKTLNPHAYRQAVRKFLTVLPDAIRAAKSSEQNA